MQKPLLKVSRADSRVAAGKSVFLIKLTFEMPDFYDKLSTKPKLFDLLRADLPPRFEVSSVLKRLKLLFSELSRRVFSIF